MMEVKYTVVEAVEKKILVWHNHIWRIGIARIPKNIKWDQMEEDEGQEGQEQEQEEKEEEAEEMVK